ncbi:hypothetical protein PR003_g29818 [Phytophthora rubi]|uniref:Secreted protein n=1 Tax=Phytophthora rubi TaxID=129364 RepID=A0A6A3H724_9STRA|nr:hypothetical protein PR001_g28885 [Phytophthora rubi]KAE8965440.1 hypothetical protein PR002_g28678 [Phytophthora rubi]KAE9273729.1 hypothetical protein PR003_g29818 [Phytophthora rubi]
MSCLRLIRILPSRAAATVRLCCTLTEHTTWLYTDIRCLPLDTLTKAAISSVLCTFVHHRSEN